MGGSFNSTQRAPSYQNSMPQEWEYLQQIKRSGYDPSQIPNMQNQMNQQMPQSDPYTDFENEFLKCSNVVQNRIMEDPEFKSVMNNCDSLIQRAVEQIVRPQVIQTQEGRISFEKLLATFRDVKVKYEKEETENMEKIQRLMNDEVVKKRMMELNNNTPTSSVQSTGGAKK